MKDKKKNGLALVISVGHSPKKPTDTATPDMSKKAGYGGDDKLKGRMTPILSSVIKELILEKARGTGIPGTQGPPLGGRAPQMRQKTKCSECGGRLEMMSAPGMEEASELTCSLCGMIEPDSHEVIPDASGADEVIAEMLSRPPVRSGDDDLNLSHPMEIAFRLLKARYADPSDTQQRWQNPSELPWPGEEVFTAPLKRPRNLGQPLDSEPMSADWLTRNQGLDEFGGQMPSEEEMREMRDIDEQRQLALQGDMAEPRGSGNMPGPPSFRDELARRTARGPASNDLRGHQALRALIMRRLMAGETLSTDELRALRDSRDGDDKLAGHPMDMSFALLKGLSNQMPLPTEQEMRFVRENLESGDPEKAAHAQMILDSIQENQ